MKRLRSTWLIILAAFVVASCGPADSDGPADIDGSGRQGTDGDGSAAEDPGPTADEAREAFTVAYSVAVHGAVQAALGNEEDGLTVDQDAREIVVQSYSLAAISDAYDSMSGRLESSDAMALSGTVTLSGGPIASLEIEVPAIDSRDGARAASVIADGVSFDLQFDAEPLRRP